MPEIKRTSLVELHREFTYVVNDAQVREFLELDTDEDRDRFLGEVGELNVEDTFDNECG